MTSAVAKKVGLALFEKHLKNYEPADPLYEMYTDEGGKEKRRKKELPPGLSTRDAKILKSVNRRAHYLDKGFTICGFRFGWTFIIGIIPMAGDIANGTLNYYCVIRKAKQAEIPNWLLRRMMLNNAVSIAIGFIPFIGDVIMAAFKANSRNAALLEEFLRIRGEEFLKESTARKQDPAVIKPGAGREPGETVSKKRTTGSFFRKRGKASEPVQGTKEVESQAGTSSQAK